MDASNMNEAALLYQLTDGGLLTRQARDTVSRMFNEIERTIRGGDTSDSDDDDCSDNESDPPVPPNGTSSNGQASTTPVTGTAPADGEQKKKKKKKKKKKNDNRPEVDALLDLDETPEAMSPYDPSKSVAERMEIAITRFRKNRKFTVERGQIFSTYLDYGGIHTGQKSFQGGASGAGPGDEDGEPDFEGMNAGIDLVEPPEDGQVVDFTQVVTTFLSQHFLRNTGWIEMSYYRDTPLVVAALLNYLLVRDVLPEYKEDLKSALAVAEQAKVELPLCKIISNGLPGRYSRACSLIYGGEWHNFLDTPWQNQDSQSLIETLGMDHPTAERIVRSVVGPDIDFQKLTLAPRVFMDLEIIHVELPEILQISDDTPDTPEEQAENDEAKLVEMVDRMLLGKDLQPQGSNPDSSNPGPEVPSEPVLAEKHIHVPILAKVTLAEIDPALTRAEQTPPETRRQIYTYFDVSIATKMLLGMRIEAFAFTLSNGMSYLEQASVYPTYYLDAEEVDASVDEWDD
ncbi:hypothetical protein BGZ65_008155 [Modicella reniformis]|uniref:Uncharacterized protein n=1 Tax=Modicella reniformis TaxID=1440133 RepID=A0A9P6M384_9FUNG|nr:hypothetical protein BGZ65_008155 [Modicella reniformis]